MTLPAWALRAFGTKDKKKQPQLSEENPVNGTNYITTRPNGTAKDNLENLPEY
ncbi:DUF3892 domain-containing protein [Klebsiella pneumoniae]